MPDTGKPVLRVDLLRSDAVTGCLSQRPVRWVVRRVRGVEGSREGPVKEYLSWETGRWVRLVGGALPAECYLEEADHGNG
jgi:hypothetical protein